MPFEDERDAQWMEGQSRFQQMVESWGTAQDPAVIRQNLYDSMVQTRVHVLEVTTQRLLTLAEAGARQVALNLSVGSSPSVCLAGILGTAEDPRAFEQWGKAFGLDVEQLQAGHRDSTRQLHHQLVEMAVQGSQEERLQAAQRDFADAVAEFESQNNSVVVAAGNDGNFPAHLLCPVPEEFTRSDLITPLTTVVGALQGDQPASYTSHPDSVTVWAPGAFRIGQEVVSGTSFAAPQVSAALARLHAQFPDSSSAEVEKKLNQA